jgi:cyclopropane-fatty-acyl-phospholipid synthase
MTIGWGSCAILLAQTHGCRVDTLTLSSEQQTLAQQRIVSLGLSHLITVHLMDYRSLPKEWKHQFDRMISIEMYEHVGKDFHEEYWKMVDWALKEQHAGGCIVTITSPDSSDYILRFARIVVLTPSS